MQSLSPHEIFLRLFFAFITGMLLGLERETHGRPAGLRTTVLACVAASMAMVLTHEYAVAYNVNDDSIIRSDPGRLAAGILTGIGFLGAGTIFRSGTFVRGVTTAAMLWFATVLGLVFGSGEWILGFIGLFLAGLTMWVLPLFEDRVRRNAYAHLTVTTNNEYVDEAEFRSVIESEDAEIFSFAFEHNLVDGHHTLNFGVKFKKRDIFALTAGLAAKLSKLPGVRSIKWE